MKNTAQQCPKCKRFMKVIGPTAEPSDRFKRIHEKYPNSSETDYRCNRCGEEYTITVTECVLSAQ